MQGIHEQRIIDNTKELKTVLTTYLGYTPETTKTRTAPDGQPIEELDRPGTEAKHPGFIVKFAGLWAWVSQTKLKANLFSNLSNWVCLHRTKTRYMRSSALRRYCIHHVHEPAFLQHSRRISRPVYHYFLNCIPSFMGHIQASAHTLIIRGTHTVYSSVVAGGLKLGFCLVVDHFSLSCSWTVLLDL